MQVRTSDRESVRGRGIDFRQGDEGEARDCTAVIATTTDISVSRPTMSMHTELIFNGHRQCR
eukprot:8451-Eustigmatos_ZCMA.PRE.1